MTDNFKITHSTHWRRVRWVHDPEYMGLVEGGDFSGLTEADIAVSRRELEDLKNGNLVCLGAIVETRCPHCKEWTPQDSLWNIVVPPDEDLEALGSELLEIPETWNLAEVGCLNPEEVGCPNPEVLEMMGGAVVTEPVPPPPEGPPNTLEKEGDTTPRKPRGPGLARIVLQFDPDTLTALRSAVFDRGTSASDWGLLEEFAVGLIERIEEGASVWEVKQKKAVD